MGVVNVSPESFYAGSVRRGRDELVRAACAMVEAGAEMIDSPDEIFRRSDMIMKVKEPMPAEYSMVREGQIVFTYFHFASSRELTDAMLERKAICVAYETISTEDGKLPLLTPMSEVAGRMSIQEGAKYLEKPQKGRGILLAGVPGVEPADVLVLGGGVVGTNAARMAAGLGARVVLLDIKMPKVDGLEVLRVIKSDPQLKSIPTVILTSSREEQDLINSYQLGVNAYVVKPVNFTEFMEAVKNVGAFWGLFNEPPPSAARTHESGPERGSSQNA